MATTPVAADYLVAVSATKVPAPSTSDTIGVPVVLTPDPLDGVNTEVLYTSATQVATSLAALEISALTAVMLTNGLGQNARAAGVLAAAYDTGAAETPVTAIERTISNGWNPGVFALSSRVVATQSLVSAWIAADTLRKSQYLHVVQSSEAGLLTTGKPAALSDCEIFNTKMLYHDDDTVGLDGAFMGFLAGINLSQGPAASTLTLTGTDAAVVTTAETNFLLANDGATLLSKDHGAAASLNQIVGMDAYDGSDWSASVTLVYAGRQVRAALLDLRQTLSLTGRPLKAGNTGIALAEAAANGPLAQMAAAGHFEPQETAPDGYTLAGRVGTYNSETAIVVDIVLYIAGEVLTVSVPIIGQEVS